MVWRFKVELHCRSRQQAMRRFDERAARGDIDDSGVATRTNARRHNAMIVGVTPPPGADPVKLGASNILTFTAIGSSSSGSLYVLGRSGAQYVIRIFGDSGKTRVLKFDRQTHHWKPL